MFDRYIIMLILSELVIIVLAGSSARATIQFDLIETLTKLSNLGQIGNEKLDPIDYFLQDILPRFYNQRPNNENGTKSEFRDYALRDTSNDDASHLSGVSV